ncbi:MAG: HAMP domain-containing histidine kinase [Gammaproteobacteria bacterium]|nr:HAMP domain-containing histidine kinase [Gammaproteobacteria bacterium]
MFDRESWLRTPRHEYRFLGLLLLSLHFALWQDFSGWPPRVLLFLHFCLFLLWLPLWSIHTRLHSRNVIAFLALAALAAVFMVPWLIIAWKIMLLGLLGGRNLISPRDRAVNTAAFVFLLIDLFMIDINHLFKLNLFSSDSSFLIGCGLACIPALFLLFSASDDMERSSHVDFFHGLSVSLITLLIVAGSLFGMQYFPLSYPASVFGASLIIALFILTVSWLWVVFVGFDDMGQLWSRHLLNIGSSFEQWLASLAHPGISKLQTSEQFLNSGFEQLAKVSWVAGIAWQSPYGQGALGIQEKHKAVLTAQSIEVTVYARHRISGTHYAHIKLLVQLLEHFHQAKRREEAYAQQAHLQAIHETGAKLTHDIKNLLQSLHAITSAIETVKPDRFGDTQRLLQGQLPHLSQRLKRTLDKLKQPDQPSYFNIPIRIWWDNLQARYAKRSIDFSMRIMWNSNIPEDAFDNVVENLLENALMKRKREPELRIRVALETSEKQLRLTVCDDGSAIPPEIEKFLLTQPVQSRDGFGIGLYQTAKQAIQTGYRLAISHNEPGRVCFELTSV